MVSRHHQQAKRVAEALDAAGFEILNRVVLNQVLVRGANDEATQKILMRAQESGVAWFGNSVWQTRPAFRISISSFRTENAHIEKLITLLTEVGPNG